MDNNFSLPDSLTFLLEDLEAAGLPKSIAQRPEFLSSLILGTAAEDSLTGTDQRDYIFGLEGSDSLEGFGGDDFLFGGEGDNTIRGGDERDRIYSNGGKDQLFGGAGNDRFRDVSGGNEIRGGDGRDTINYRNIDGPIGFEFDIGFNSDTPSRLQEGILRITQDGLEPDTISSIERIIGPEGKANNINFQKNFIRPPRSASPQLSVFAPAIDVNLAQNRIEFEDQKITIENFRDFIGSVGNDVIRGDSADNRLDGDFGANVLEGRKGNDFLTTFDSDTLIGGSGRDTFELKAAQKELGGRFRASLPLTANTIVDFETNTDKIQLSRIGGSFTTDSITRTVYRGFSDLESGALDADLFQVLGGDPIPQGAYVSYDGTTGDLFYTSGQPSDDTTKIATLQGAPGLTASDIVVV